MNQEAVQALVEQVIGQTQLEVDRIEFGSAGRRTQLRIFLDGDGPLGQGPSLDEIAGATRALSKALDESPVTGEAPYVLEVSSRGVSRPLTAPRHYRRNAGRLVKLTLGDVERTGRIGEVDDEGVHLIDEAGASERIAFATITKAVVQVELTKLPDEDDADIEDADGVEEE